MNDGFWDRHAHILKRMGQLAKMGRSFLQITQTLNSEFSRDIKKPLTRNMVLGKCSRMGWTNYVEGVSKRPPVRTKRGSKIQAPLPKGTVVAKPVVVAKKIQAPLPEPEADPLFVPERFNANHYGEGVDLIHLTQANCHWPLGAMSDRPPYKFCGKPRADDHPSYCKEHRRVSKRPY